jgi:hypothetical protein
VIGLVVIGVGGYHMLTGWTRTFLRDLNLHPGNFAAHAGLVGHIAKGVALALVGVLFVTAAGDTSSIGPRDWMGLGACYVSRRWATGS